MSERKGSLQLVSNGSAKFFGHQQNSKNNQPENIKIHKYRGSFGTIDQNLFAMSKTFKGEVANSKKEAASILVERHTNVQNLAQKSSGFSSYRNSLQQSLLSKLRKLGYVSNGNSKQNSPAKKRKSQNETVQHNHNNKRTITSQQMKIEKYTFNKGLFQYKYAIGKGGFGKVWKVELKRNKKVYAMKQMSKALIIAKKSVPSVMNEKKLLASLKNGFLVNMVQSFQDRQTLYLVMDYLPGGDLRHHIAKKRRFTQEEAKFLIACIFLGLEYLHAKDIIHRDIKPQNIVLDEKGYARITDLGVARTFRPNNSADTSGTPGYMAPQVLCRQNHTFSVDHFAMGIIAYQLMLRKRPYYGRNRKQIRDEILAKQVQIKKHEIPEDWSLEAADFINRLIQRKPNSRLGFNSSSEIRNHPWLRQYPLQKVQRKQFQSPYLGSIDSLEKGSFSESKFSSENTETRQLIMQNEVLLRDPQVQRNYWYSQNYSKGTRALPSEAEATMPILCLILIVFEFTRLIIVRFAAVFNNGCLNYNLLTVMKLVTPAANIVIATLYLLLLIGIGYIAKLVFKANSKIGRMQTKYSSQNLSKGLSHPLMQEHINPFKTLAKGLAFKYNIIGTAMNENKYHLLKEIFIIAIICVASLSINRITLWPIALAFVFVGIFFFTSQYFKLPTILDICQKIEQENKNALNVMPELVQIEPTLAKQQKRQVTKGCHEPSHSYKYILFMSAMLFVILVLISETMFTIYNSISNLGGLNIGSVIIVIIIDQLLIRPALAAVLFLAAKLILHRIQNANSTQPQTINKLLIFQIPVFRNLCEQFLLQEMNIWHSQLGEASDAQMGVSPSKKKTLSPAKVPKAIPALQSQTLMQIHKVDQLEEQELQRIQQVQEVRSPIKQIQNSMMKHDSILFTSAERQMFGDAHARQEEENDQRQMNKSITMDNINKIKINPNQFFSIQRLPKQQLTHQEQKIEEQDGVVLVQTEFNPMKTKNNKEQSNTIDLEFSPGKKKRHNARYKNKRRQLIITGSSPYLEYLPDMMKKEKQLRKSQNPPSQTHLHSQTQPHVQSASRKIL